MGSPEPPHLQAQLGQVFRHGREAILRGAEDQLRRTLGLALGEKLPSSFALNDMADEVRGDAQEVKETLRKSYASRNPNPDAFFATPEIQGEVYRRAGQGDRHVQTLRQAAKWAIIRESLSAQVREDIVAAIRSDYRDKLPAVLASEPNVHYKRGDPVWYTGGLAAPVRVTGIVANVKFLRQRRIPTGHRGEGSVYTVTFRYEQVWVDGILPLCFLHWGRGRIESDPPPEERDDWWEKLEHIGEIALDVLAIIDAITLVGMARTAVRFAARAAVRKATQLRGLMAPRLPRARVVRDAIDVRGLDDATTVVDDAATAAPRRGAAGRWTGDPAVSNRGTPSAGDEIARVRKPAQGIRDRGFEATRSALDEALRRPPLLASQLGLIGTVSTRRGFRRLLVRKLRDDPTHSLSFLLVKRKLRRSTAAGIDQDVWLEMPEIIEAGHAVSARSLVGKLKGNDRFVVMSAHHNRLFGATIEHPSKGGWMELPNAIDIGGIPVHTETAIDWVAKGLLRADELAMARPIVY